MTKHLLELRTKLNLYQTVMAYLLGVNRSNYIHAELEWRALPKTSRADYLAILEAIDSNAFQEAANNSTTQNELLEAFVNKLLKERMRLVRQISIAEKRLVHYMSMYRMLNEFIVSFEGLMGSNTGNYSETFLKRVDLKHGRTKMLLKNTILHNLYKTKERISIYTCRLELIDRTINNPLGLYKDHLELCINT
jgi:hypothetical protein